MARLFLSAAHKSSGKTTVTLGLCAALAARGLGVQSFKKGPDYIDPMWLGRAAGRVCRNLDFHTQSPEAIGASFARHAAGADLALVEGNMGLHDGVATDGRDSSAALAKLLRAPVLLVLDSAGMSRGIAAQVMGFTGFDPALSFAGIILNKVAGSRHEAKLRAAIERYSTVPVLGAIHRSAELALAERHLGLIPVNEAGEAGEADTLIGRIRDTVAAQVDLDRVLEAARAAPPLDWPPEPAPSPAAGSAGRIAIARDSAFGFYYPEDLEALAAEGFELVPFNALTDPDLPRAIDGLLIGGGFPETRMDALEANAPLRRSIRTAIEGGLPTYAECGGLMYLSRSIAWEGRSCAMVGALPLDTVMHARPQGRGYVRMRETGHFPWPTAEGAEAEGAAVVSAHEFHHAGVAHVDPACRFAYRVERGHGFDGRHDGVVVANTLAAFTHRRGVGGDSWPHRFAAFIRRCKTGTP